MAVTAGYPKQQHFSPFLRSELQEVLKRWSGYRRALH
jgi:hypothetical protein